jgi:hypothetical protein
MIKAYEMPFKAITLVAAADVSGKRYRFATCDATGALKIAGAGERAMGVLQTPGIDKEPCNVMTDGVSFIRFGGIVAAGQEVQSDANGDAIVLATGKSNGVCLVGGASGAIGSILIK